MKNNEKYGEINYGKPERAFKSALDRVEYAGEKANHDTVQDLYGEHAETATAEGRNKELYERIAALNEFNRNLQRDMLSDNERVRKKAEILAQAMDDSVNIRKENGVWKVYPRKGGVSK